METERLRHSSQYRLLTLLSSINPNGQKDLVIHEDLMKPLDQVVGAKKLRDQGVEKMFKLGSGGPPWKNSTRIYLIPAVYSVAENVTNQLKSDKVLTSGYQYHVIVVPKVLSLIQTLFESLGALDLAVFHSFSWDFIPLDCNLISLEMTGCFRAIFVKEDCSLLGSISKSLMSFECLYGKFPSITTLGRVSSTIHNLLEVWHREIQPTLPSESEFTHLIMMDRDVDFVSVLLTQLTYEGVLDENFRMQSGFVTLNQKSSAPEGQTAEVQRMMLNSTKDDIYAEIRGRHISSVFGHLSDKAKHLQGLRDKKNTASIEEMKQFVANDLRHIQSQQKSLALHITACEMVMNRQTGVLEELLSQQLNITAGRELKDALLFIEDAMSRQYDRTAVLRLICLYSLLHEGVPDCKSVQKQFLQSYGYHNLPTLHKLQHMKLLSSKDSGVEAAMHLPDKLARVVHLAPQLQPQSIHRQQTFRKINQRLNLTSEASPQSVKSGQHSSYVFGGTCTPLAYRLVEKCLARDRDAAALDDLARCYGNDLRSSGSFSLPNPKVLVLLVGGVTLAEVASLDLLAKQTGHSIVIAGTNIINGPSMIDDISM